MVNGNFSTDKQTESFWIMGKGKDKTAPATDVSKKKFILEKIIFTLRRKNIFYPIKTKTILKVMKIFLILHNFNRKHIEKAGKRADRSSGCWRRKGKG